MARLSTSPFTASKLSSEVALPGVSAPLTVVPRASVGAVARSSSRKSYPAAVPAFEVTVNV